MRIGQDDDLEAEVFEMTGKSLFTRTVEFETRKWGRFEWRYGNKRERAEWDADNLLILEKVIVGREGERRERVAQLVRGEQMRTAGTKKASAGNGGRLMMDLQGGQEKGEVVSEVVVVVTVLVMLKKEIDRLRMIQIAAMSGGGGGGP